MSDYPGGLYSLEHSQYSEDKGSFPYHVGPLDNAIKHNLIDWEHNSRGENKWQIVFIGTMLDCHDAMNALIKRRKNQKKEKAKKEKANP